MGQTLGPLLVRLLYKLRSEAVLAPLKEPRCKTAPADWLESNDSSFYKENINVATVRKTPRSSELPENPTVTT